MKTYEINAKQSNPVTYERKYVFKNHAVMHGADPVHSDWIYSNHTCK